jgi:HAD superfamily hydrolase (TIGR01509 family)
MDRYRLELPRPEAVIFDLDGTLVGTVETRIRAWLMTFAEAGIPAERGDVAQLIGSDGKRLAHEVARRAGRPLSDERAARIDRQSGEIYSRLNTDPRPLPGARELLLALDERRLPWAIATSSLRGQVSASVQALELPREPIIVDGSHVEQAKPEPELLLRAAQRLGVQPERSWYVGDATWDMLAAKAARMHAIGVTSGAASTPALTAAGADLVVGSLVELRDALPAPD